MKFDVPRRWTNGPYTYARHTKHTTYIGSAKSTYKSSKGEATADITHHDNILLSETKVTWQKSVQRFVLHALKAITVARKLRGKAAR